MAKKKKKIIACGRMANARHKQENICLASYIELIISSLLFFHNYVLYKAQSNLVAQEP